MKLIKEDGYMFALLYIATWCRITEVSKTGSGSIGQNEIKSHDIV